ncbi:hypothetical protein HYDPIDRAFT_27129 [Hydnomerulius pinastri MD-312]|nr:hypothetical protein HYDPIDRAFT_27129 [Hydnomerulius pinastri MD-312]
MPHIQDALDRTTSMDTAPRMLKVASASVAPLLEHLVSSPHLSTDVDLGKIAVFRAELARRLESLLTELKCAYLGVELGDVRRGGVAGSTSASSFSSGSTTTPSSSSPTSARTPLFNLTRRTSTPASRFLAPRTRIMYEFVRRDLGISMHGADNLRGGVFGMRDQADELPGLSGLGDDEAGLGKKVDTTIGDKVAVIVEAIRDGRMGRVLAKVCEGL